MNTKPMLFNFAMVQAILNGSKTMTRRIINLKTLKIQTRGKIKGDLPFVRSWAHGKVKGYIHQAGAVSGLDCNGAMLGMKPEEFDFLCPYTYGTTYLERRTNGRMQWCIRPRPEQRLWAKETWRTWASLDHLSPSGINSGALIEYRDGWTSLRDGKPAFGMSDNWRPSIFMPMWAARIDLLILRVRVERLQDISEEDCIAEGIIRGTFHTIYRDEYRLLWDSIYDKRPGCSWKDNPWVYAIEFTRLTP